MLAGESVEGEKLVFEEGDLLVCTHSRVAHIVFLGTLCNTRMQYWGAPLGKLRLWTKIGACQRQEDYAATVRQLGYNICRACCRGLERYGAKLL